MTNITNNKQIIQMMRPQGRCRCQSGLTIKPLDSVRCVILIEDLILKSQSSLQRNDKFYKAFGLPIPAVYLTTQRLELDRNSEEYKLTEDLLRNSTKKDDLDLSELVHSIMDEKKSFIPYQAETALSYTLIHDDFYHESRNMECLSFYGNNYDLFEKTVNSVFDKISHISIPKERMKDNDDLNDFLNRSLRQSHISEELHSAKSFFYSHGNTAIDSLGKNQYKFIRAFFMFNVLDYNSISLHPVNLVQPSSLSFMQCIQRANLKSYDSTLQELDIKYETENMLVVTLSDIHASQKNDIVPLKINIDFEGKDFIIKKASDLFPINTMFKGNFNTIKIINE